MRLFVRPTHLPCGGYYVTHEDGSIERFGATYGDMPRRFKTEQAAINAAQKLLRQYANRKTWGAAVLSAGPL